MKKENELEKIKSRFNNYLPEFVLKAPYLEEIFDSGIIESYYLNEYGKKLLNELSISTVTEKSIDKWERFAGINNKHLDVKSRIDLVIKKFSLKVHANHFNFVSLLRVYDPTIIVEEIISDYTIKIKSYNFIGYTQSTSLLDIINNYKPAHIGYKLEINRSVSEIICVELSINRRTINKIRISPDIDNQIKVPTYIYPSVNKVSNQRTNITPITQHISLINNYLGIGINVSVSNIVKFRHINKIKHCIYTGIAINKIKHVKVNI